MDALGTDQPGTDQPGTDEPGTDQPGTDQPGTDEPGTDQPGTDQPGTDQPGTDQSGTDRPGTDRPGTDRPAGSDALVDRYDAILLDLDGVLYRATEPIEGAADAVAELRRRGVHLAFVTNNSSRTPEKVAEKLRDMGVEAGVEEVVSSAVATADVLAARGGGTAYVIGETGIREALREAGLTVLDGDDPGEADYVVVGVDSDVTYARLRTAALLVQRGATLVATNADPSYPAPEGVWPGAGALLAVITTTTGREADDIVGKPRAPLMHSALERSGGSRPLVVGDRLDTDISGAATVGWDSLLVFTGVSRPADLVAAADLPTYAASSLAALFEPPVDIRPAEADDAVAIAAMLDEASLQANGVIDRIGETLVAERNRRVVGSASLELFDGWIAHLRSLVVAPDLRGLQVGTLLVARTVRLALDRGASEVDAVTETAAGFFDRMGFERIGTRDALPAPILSTPMVALTCSESSVAFRWRPPGALVAREAPGGA